MAESKPRVLLVEDTRSLAVVYEQYLAQDGYEVQLADCGQQALALVVVALDDMAVGLGVHRVSWWRGAGFSRSGR